MFSIFLSHLCLARASGAHTVIQGSRPFPRAQVLHWIRGKREHAGDWIEGIFRSQFWKNISYCTHILLARISHRDPLTCKKGWKIRSMCQWGKGNEVIRTEISLPYHLISYSNFFIIIELWWLNIMYVKHIVNAWHAVGVKNRYLLSLLFSWKLIPSPLKIYYKVNPIRLWRILK